MTSKAQNNIYKEHNQRASNLPLPEDAVDLNQGAIDFVPSPDEVARRAYFTYVNQGSRPGHEVQHWLEAEAQLLAERNLTRVHGFHNRS